MKLDRNINPEGRGKYALILQRALNALSDEEKSACLGALDYLKSKGVLDLGNTPQSEFFVIRLKDQNAERALIAYADSADGSDSEWAAEVRELADRARNLDSQMPD